MGTDTTKGGENVYFRCRKTAAIYNDRLGSREGAAELLGVSASSLADYELGITKVVPVDKVTLMADLYNAPELKNHYCTNVCPIGESTVKKLEIEDLDRIAIKVLAAFRHVPEIKESVLEITEDGVISESEIPALKAVLAALDVISQYSQEFNLWAEKHGIK